MGRKKLYLPDNSDEAISFSITSHELGHLVKKGRIQPNREDFEATYNEELRAWEEGWRYLEKHLVSYYDNPECIEDLRIIKDKVKDKFLNITLLTKQFYQISKTKNIKEQRDYFVRTEQGKLIKSEIDNLQSFIEEILISLNKESFLKKVDWNKLVTVIKKSLIDIEKDNN